jgi:membrane protease YdiL (CAAX protease family)
MIALPAPAPLAAPARLVLAVAGLGALVAVRGAVNGSTAASAFGAGLVFGLGLVALALAAGWRAGRPKASAVVLGLGGGMVLVVLPLVAAQAPPAPPVLHPQPLAAWIVATAVVAGAEEIALRGALWQTAHDAHGPFFAIILTSAAFALMHVPLYGWQVVPLDLAVGLFLGGLRLVSGGVAAPAAAHALADLASWWM